MAGNSISCKKFTDYLSRRAEHLDTDIIRDITPAEGWIGHVSTGKFNAEDGVEHTFDRINRVFPDLSGCWADVQVGNCTGQPCDPAETEIGFGLTRDSYKLQYRSYKTQLFCFDLSMSADRAKEQFSGIVSNLKDAANIIVSDRLKTEAFRIATHKELALFSGGSTPTPITTWTWSADCTTLHLNAGVIPDSKLTIQELQRWVQPLIMNGALGTTPGMPPIFTLVTDLETAWELREGNASLTSSFRFTDFAQGGALYKYGITDAIGNFGIRIDPFPMRFQIAQNGTDLERVFPYTNTAASQVSPAGAAGIKGIVNQTYIDAPVQISFIWSEMSMQSLVRDTV